MEDSVVSSQNTCKDSSEANKKGPKEGRTYEKLVLLLLSKKGYELSKENPSKFCDFSIGIEVRLGKDFKFDDTVFRYTDDDNINNLIILQVKHLQGDHQIDSKDLSVEASKTKRYRGAGKKSKEFNLIKYFISYLNAREELKSATSKEFRNGTIKYVVIFTNASLDTTELISKGFCLKEAPCDIINLFTLETQEPNDYYQFSDISSNLREKLVKSSDLHRVARELAKYVVWKDYIQNKIMRIDTSPIKYYHVALAREVIQKSDEVKNKNIVYKNKTKNESYCDAQFRDDFLKNGEITSKQELRNAVFEAIKELDESKKYSSDNELKNLLKDIKLKIVPHFGKTKKNTEENIPSEWKTVKDEDITDFLKCLVFTVNRPRNDRLEVLCFNLVKDTVVGGHYNTSLKQIIGKIETAGPELKKRIEEYCGIYRKTNCIEKWISGEKLTEFHDEQLWQIILPLFVTAVTLRYESEVFKCGKFKKLGKMEKCLDSFFSNSSKILCVNTSQTLLSSIKIMQYLNSNRSPLAEYGRIYTNLDGLNNKENRDIVASAFELQKNVLLVIEYRFTVNKKDVEHFYNKLYNAKSNKRIIFIIPQNERNENFINEFQKKGNFMLEYDFVDIKNFVPREDPFNKEVIIFQGKEERVSLSNITGIVSWNSYVKKLSQETSEQSTMDPMTFVEIFSSDKIEVGSKPPGTSSVEGAYANMCEEINVETLANKLMSQEQDNDTNDLYIISGIYGSSKQEKADKLIQYLGQDNENKEFKNHLEQFKNRLKIVSVDNLLVVDDQFKDVNFKEICQEYSEKLIFWICIKWENNVTKFNLLQIYNPKFYLNRKFKKIIIKNDLKKHLIKDDLSEMFIFHCSQGEQELYNFMYLNDREKERVEASCMIKIFSLKCDAEDSFKTLSKQKQTVHFLVLEEEQIVWCDSHGSLSNLLMHIDDEEEDENLFEEINVVEEDSLIRKIKDRKVVIFANDPGMGKTTTLIKFYETETESSSIIKSHWVIEIKLRNHLKAVRGIELKKDDIDIASVVEFLSKIDLKLNNNLAKNLLSIALVKSKRNPKTLLLSFDGFDEVLDEKDRNRILLLLNFIKDETAAKLWITTRLHFKKYLEKELSTIAIQFVPMDDSQKAEYVTKYLQQRLYLILNEKIFNGIFTSCNERGEIKSILTTYIDAFLNKMELTFKGNISRFIGTPLQLQLMLEGSARHFKSWIEHGEGKVPVFNYLGNDVCEVYENFIDKKYEVYFQKIGIREGIQKRQEKIHLIQYHKEVAKFRMYEVKPKISLDEFLDKILLAGITKSEVRDPQFIHKTFEEFFASNVFIHWIEKGPNKFPNTNKQEYLLTVILMQRDYQLVRTFMNLQLQKMTEHRKDKGQNKLNINNWNYGNIAAKLLNEEKSPLIDENGTPLHTAVREGNKFIASFLLDSLKGQQDVLRKFLFTHGKYQVLYNTYEGTALHLACSEDEVAIVTILLDAAERISNDFLQEFLKCLNNKKENALYIAAKYNNNDEIVKELLKRTNCKLDLLLTQKSALSIACSREKNEFVAFLLEVFEPGEHSLKQLLLHQGEHCSALCHAKSTTTVEMLISAAKSMGDNNETLKNMLLPKEGYMPFEIMVKTREIDVVEKLLNVAKDLDDDNHTLKQLLLKERRGGSVLHVAAKRGDVNIIKLLLNTAADLGINMLKKLIMAVDKKRRNTIQVMIEREHEEIFAEYFKMLKDFTSKSQKVWKRVKKMFENVPLKSRLYPIKKRFIFGIKNNDIYVVKNILSKTKNSRVCPNESLRILLLAKDWGRRSTLYNACQDGKLEIMKELLTYAMHIDDKGATLKELLTKPSYMTTPFQVLKGGYTSEIKQIVESVIFEARNCNREHAANILDNINKEYDEVPEESDDKGATLKELLTDFYMKIPFQVHDDGYTSESKKIVENIFSLSRNNDRENAASITETFNNEYDEVKSSPEECLEKSDDKGATLKELLTDSYMKIPFQVHEDGYKSRIMKTISFLLPKENATSNTGKIINNYDEVKFSPEESLEESDDNSEKSGEFQKSIRLKKKTSLYDSSSDSVFSLSDDCRFDT